MYNICLSVETKKSQYFVLQEFYKIFFFNSRYRPYLADVAEMHIFFKSLFRKNLMSITDP